MLKLLFSLAIIIIGLATGYTVRILAARGRLRPLLPLPELRKLLQKTALLAINPVAFFGAAWAANLSAPRLAVLPFIDLFALAAGAALAHLGSRLLKMPRRKAVVFTTAGSFTNTGSIGLLIVFVFLGERAVAYVPVYKLFEDLWYYTVLFPLARSGGKSPEATTDRSPRRPILADPFFLAALASFGGGFVLNLAGVPRPDFFPAVNAVFIPLGSLLLLVSIGLSLSFGNIRPHLKEAGLLAGIKFLLVPAGTVLLAYLAGLGAVDGGIPLRVALILSAMPVAFTALVPPTLYDLDVDLANACWFVTNALLVVVLPLLMVVVGAL